MLWDFYKTRVLWLIFWKIYRISANISRKNSEIRVISKANSSRTTRTVSLKPTRTIMNTGYANSSRTLFEQLFANRIGETQTPEINCETNIELMSLGETVYACNGIGLRNSHCRIGTKWICPHVAMLWGIPWPAHLCMVAGFSTTRIVCS